MPERKPTTPSSTSPQGRKDASTVLVIDDNPTVTRALTSILDHAGYQVAPCHSGQEALNYAASEPPAAALIDIHLPDISGLELSQKLRDRFGPGWPIIVVSGDTSMENLRSLNRVGASYFISKPFNPERLLQRLHELVAATVPSPEPCDGKE